jgi:hypothetical protein
LTEILVAITDSFVPCIHHHDVFNSAAGIAACFPSIFTLLVYLYIPFYARQMLYYWRAIQVYERQPIKTRPDKDLDEFPSFAPLLILSYGVLLFIRCVFDGSNQKEPRIITYIFQKIPHIALFAIVMDVLLDLHQMYPAWTDRKVYRITDLSWEEYGKVAIRPIGGQRRDGGTGKERNDPIDGIIYCFTMMFISLAVIKIANILTDQSPIYFTFLYGVIVSNRIYFSILRLHQFTYFVRETFWTVLPVCCFFTYIACIDKSKPVEPVNSSQMLILILSFMTQSFTIFPCALVCFAYRYDADRAGLGIVEDQMADEIIRQNKQREDQFGRKPILVSEVAISPEILSKASFPTFNAAYITMIIIQVFGIVVDVRTPRIETYIYPLRADQLDVENGYFVPWSLLSYIAVVIVIIISVRRQSRIGDTTTLWTYREIWIPDSYEGPKIVPLRVIAEDVKAIIILLGRIVHARMQPIQVLLLQYAACAFFPLFLCIALA